MRSVQEWFDSYSADHQNRINRGFHWVCVPIIMWAVIAALWTLPAIERWTKPGFWAVAVMFFAFLFYYRLSRKLGLAMVAVFIVSGLLAAGLYALLGARDLLMLAIALFVLGWIGQFVGHAIEGRRPAFLTNVVQLLIGPAWLMGKLLRRSGIGY